MDDRTEGTTRPPRWLTLFRIVGDATDPFTERNVRRLRLLAGLALGHLTVAIAAGPVEIAMQDALGFETLDTELEFGVPVFLALMLVAVAEVWRRGVALRTEQELTIWCRPSPTTTHRMRSPCTSTRSSPTAA
jgi:hypothetical protein